MEGMGLKLIPVVVRHLLGPLSMFEPMAGTSWTHSYIVQTVLMELPQAAHPPSPLTPPAHLL